MRYVRAGGAGGLLALSLACGGAMDNAKQAARDRVEQELAEQLVKQAGGLDEIDIDGGNITVGKDGDRMELSTATDVPPEFPMTMPAGFTVENVARVKQDTKRSVTVFGTAPAVDPAAIRAAMEGSGFTLDFDASTADAVSLMSSRGDAGETLSVMASKADDGFSVIVTWLQPDA